MQKFYFSVSSNSGQLINANETLFWSLVIVALTLAGIYYFISTRPKGYEMKSARSRQSGIFVSLLIACSIISLAYFVNWTRFYQLEVKDQELCLSYFYPKRRVIVPIRELKILKQVDSHNNQAFLKIEASSGREYNSAKMHSWSLGKNYEDLQQAIASQFQHSN